MKNKFALDLPRLKIGASKAETKPRKEIPIGFDSPPPTPKSVRPPLSPGTNYALRTACALVLQNYKPSDVVYEEQYGELSQDAQEDLEYEVVRSAVEREIESPVKSPVQPVFTRKARQRTLSGELISERWARERRPAIERSPGSEEWSSSGQRRSLLERAEELRSQLNFEKNSPSNDGHHHKRSASSPLMLTGERIGPARDILLQAEGATPQTEDEEYPWTASTAPTTAGITPAHSSNRTSNVLQHKSANDSTAKFLASDTEWMRQELEKYKKTQDESNTRPNSEEPATAGATVDEVEETKEPSVVQAPPLPPIPSQKSVSSHQREDSNRSGDLSRSGSRKRRSTPRSESRAEMDLLRPESRQTTDEPLPQSETVQTQYSNAPASHSFHARPLAGTTAPYQSHNPSAAPSRNRSLRRQFREFIRPSSRNQSREASRPGSRARSVESFASSNAPSESSKWRRFRPFNRNRDSAESDDLYRPSSKDSRRGRDHDVTTPAGKNGKPAINLNRELPPLPSLDQWKDDDFAVESQVQSGLTSPSVVSPIQRAPSNARQSSRIVSPTTRSQKQSVDSTASTQPRDSVLIDNSLRIHPKRISSLGAPTEGSKYPLKDPASQSLPQSPAIGMEHKQDLRQSRSIQGFDHTIDQTDIISTTIDENPDRPAVPPKDRTFHPNRASTHINSGNMGVGRTMSQRMPFAARASGTSNTEMHFRTISDQNVNFSRKLSSEDHNRVHHDLRYRNLPESTPTNSSGSPRFHDDLNGPLGTDKEVKEKKKRWWKPSRSSKKEKSGKRESLFFGGGNSNGL